MRAGVCAEESEQVEEQEDKQDTENILQCATICPQLHLDCSLRVREDGDDIVWCNDVLETDLLRLGSEFRAGAPD